MDQPSDPPDPTRCNMVQGNRIGTNAEATAALPYYDPAIQFTTGVLIDRASENLIGGDSEAAANIISGHPGQGVWIVAGEDNGVRNNKIGTGPNGLTAVRAGDAPGDPVSNGGNGVLVSSSFSGPSTGNVIAENTIAYSGRDGVRIASSRDFDSVGNKISATPRWGPGKPRPTAGSTQRPRLYFATPSRNWDSRLAATRESSRCHAPSPTWPEK